MNRYTEKVDGIWSVSCKYEEPPYPVVTQEVIDRLAAYEDTGLEPEEVAKIREDVENGYMKSTARRYGISVARLRELAQADREGRCVVLPCKFGNKVYFPLLGRIIEKTVYSIVTFSNSQRIYCDGTSEFFRPENFGKTVFLTRAAAEKALEEMEETRNG